MRDSTKLLTICGSMSDVLYGGELGWERVDFDKFIQDCRTAIVFGIRAKKQGFTLDMQISLPKDLNPDEGLESEEKSG